SVEINADMRRPEVRILDDVVHAGRLAARRRVVPLGVHTPRDTGPDAQPVEGRLRREMLDVDPHPGALDRGVLDPRALHRRTGPDPADRAAADAHPPNRAGAAEPK